MSNHSDEPRLHDDMLADSIKSIIDETELKVNNIFEYSPIQTASVRERSYLKIKELLEKDIEL